jgi:hypothetical protein
MDDDVAETQAPVVDSLGDLLKDEDLLAALRHALRVPSQPTETVVPAGGFTSVI